MPLDDKEFKISGTTYRVQKLSGWAAVKFIRETRAELGETINVDMLKTIMNSETTVEADARASDIIAAFAEALFKVSAEFERKLMARMFETVRFTNEGAVSPQKLAGAEDMAFSDPLDAYEVLLRCLAVNFTGSLRRIASRLDIEIQGLPQSAQSE